MINVREFVQANYQPYHGDQSFLQGPTQRTLALLRHVEDLLENERKNGRPHVALDKHSGISHFGPGYLDKDKELIVGLQTDEPLKRMINPYGGIKMVEDALTAYGYTMNPDLIMSLRGLKTHNQGVFDAYTQKMRLARKTGLLTGLPDAYGRGRIIGDFRRIPLYGIDALIKDKQKDHMRLSQISDQASIQLREEVTQQIKALESIKVMASSYGYDVSQPAQTAQEAIQFLYFGYLAGVKENNGAAMSLGRVTTFLDIYLERDLNKGTIDEVFAQELIDQFVLKLRLVRHLRTPEYDALFAGDPNWITEALGGMGLDGRTLVTKTTFRFLHSLTNLGASPEPNMTVLWSEKLPRAFKDYTAQLSVQTSALQYENDDLMRVTYGDDYGIACCVSAMRMGQDMQFFGARCNLPKVLLYAINGGCDEVLGTQVLEGLEAFEGPVLEYDWVKKQFDKTMDQVAKLYVETMNVIHHMHDKYAYEASLMALHQTDLHRMMAFGLAGLSIVADALSAIKHAKVIPIRKGKLIVDYEILGDYPQYGNDDDRVDRLAVDVVQAFSDCLKRYPTYRGAQHTLSVLTITSNVVYGKKTGPTPDGRKAFEPFAPGANPLHGREMCGPLAAMNSVAKIPYRGCADDGISYTFSIVPSALGPQEGLQKQILAQLIEGYFKKGGHHINVNVLDKSLLLDAVDHPERYPNLTIRVSGYAVHFTKLTREQQMEVIGRSYHGQIN